MSAEILTTPQFILHSKGTGCLQVKSCLGLQRNSEIVFVDQVKSRKPDKRFRVLLFTRDHARTGKSGCLSHLCLKSREHTYISCESHEQQSGDSINMDFIEKLMDFQTEVVPRSSSPSALPLKLVCFLACSQICFSGVQNKSSVLYFCSLLSNCSANVNVFKHSRQVPFLKSKTCHILAFIMASSRVMASSRI